MTTDTTFTIGDLAALGRCPNGHTYELHVVAVNKVGRPTAIEGRCHCGTGRYPSFIGFGTAKSWRDRFIDDALDPPTRP